MLPYQKLRPVFEATTNQFLCSVTGQKELTIDTGYKSVSLCSR